MIAFPYGFNPRWALLCGVKTILLAVLMAGPIDSTAQTKYLTNLSCPELLASHVTYLIPGATADQQIAYFSGTDEEREAHNQEMGVLGHQGVTELFERYKASLPAHQAVLEVGPFLRPIAVPHGTGWPWVVWEFDTAAAQKIADSGKAAVFRLDLNQITSPQQWEAFWRMNAQAINAEGGECRQIGCTLMSSVLNYIDYTLVLGQVIDHMADRGILIIGNSKVGDKAMMGVRRPPNGSQILEFLALNHPDQIEILPGSKLTLDSFEGSRTGIELGVRVNHGSRPRVEQNDLYEQGLGLYTEFVAKPYPVKYPNQKYERQNEYDEYWRAEDPDTVAKAKKEIQEEKRKWSPNIPTNRIAEVENQRERNHLMARVVAQSEAGTTSFNELRDELSRPTRERFLPERHIFLEALKLDVSERPAFIQGRIAELFKRLRHSDPWYSTGLQ